VAAKLVLGALLIPSALFGIVLPGLGAEGMALASLMASGAFYIASRLVNARFLGVREKSRLRPAIIAATVQTAIILPMIGLVGIDSSRLTFVPVTIVSVPLFYATLFLLRDLNKRGLALFRSAASPAGISRYVRNELGDEDLDKSDGE
jgi:hypothetical protein